MNILLSALTALFFVFSAAPASAQQAAPEVASKTQNIQTAETGWQVVCRAVSQDRTKLGCSLIHETYSAQDRMRLTSVEIVKAEKNRTMVVSVPQGVSLKEGIEFGIDGAKQSGLVYSHCMNNSCFATTELADAAVNALKKGKMMELSFQDLQGSKIKTEVPLIGFAQSLAKAD